jgi:hypothetical protein
MQQRVRCKQEGALLQKLLQDGHEEAVQHTSIRKRIGLAAIEGGSDCLVFFLQMVFQCLSSTSVVPGGVGWLLQLMSLQLPSSGSRGVCIFRNFSGKARMFSGYIVVGVLCIICGIASAISKKRRVEINGAAALLAMFGYTAVSETTLTLLNCAEVPKGSGRSVLFQAGDQPCGSWQWPFSVLMSLLVMAPVCMLILSLKNNRSLASSNLWALLSVNYKQTESYWPCVLLLQRWGMAATSTLLQSSINCSALLAVLSCSALSLHLTFKPFRRADTNNFQTVCCVCLIGVTVFISPSNVLSQASVEYQGSISMIHEVVAGQAAIYVLAAGPFLFILVVCIHHCFARASHHRSPDSDFIFVARPGGSSFYSASSVDSASSLNSKTRNQYSSSTATTTTTTAGLN